MNVWSRSQVAVVVGALVATLTAVTPAQAVPLLATDLACPGVIDTSELVDVAGGTHADAVACAVAWELMSGDDRGRFTPNGTLTRGEAATLLVAFITQAGGTLVAPAGELYRFSDAVGEHQAAIETLATAGIVQGVNAAQFATNAPVTRGQFATMLAGTLATFNVLPITGDNRQLRDVTATRHDQAIGRLAAAGIVAGRTDGRFLPDAALTRGQGASFGVRAAGLLVTQGLTDAPYLRTQVPAPVPAPDVPLPDAVIQGGDFTQIDTAAQATCAVTGTKKAYCWGWGAIGKLGNGDDLNRLLPVAVATTTGLTDTNVAYISGDSLHTCAVTVDGAAYCWGRGQNGRLGNGDTADQFVPVTVATDTGLTAVAKIATGTSHTCALTTGGKVYCWGQGPRLGNGALGDSSKPVAVDTTTGLTDTNVAQIAVGGNHSCAVTTGGKAYCWGFGSNGELGDSLGASSLVPVAVATTTGLTDTNVAQIAAGFMHTCALTTDGKAYCWGFGGEGRLGNGSLTKQVTPVAVATDATRDAFARIAGGTAHTCAVTTAGKAYCWGLGNAGRLGTGSETNQLTPVAVVTGTGLTDTNVVKGAISAGSNYTCAVIDTGDAYCWGFNADGQLGDGTTTNRLSPVAVSTPE